MTRTEARTCAHCGAKDVSTLAAGGAAVGMQPLCHPYVGDRMDCYSLVTLHKHPMPCEPCAELNWARL